MSFPHYASYQRIFREIFEFFGKTSQFLGVGKNFRLLMQSCRFFYFLLKKTVFRVSRVTSLVIFGPVGLIRVFSIILKKA